MIIRVAAAFLSSGALERRHPVRDRLDPGHGRAAVREGSQQQERRRGRSPPPRRRPRATGTIPPVNHR